MHDPRRPRPPLPRDIAALTFIGEGYEVAQYQLHAAIFPTVSPVVVSNFVRRATRNGWIVVERWNGVGINRLRLTASGFDVVIRAGGDEQALFVPRRPVATKDVPHTLWMNDLRVALVTGAVRRFDVVVPAWQLQRRLTPPPAAIPDVLAIANETATTRAFVFACEVDLGGERLSRTFLPKLETLDRLLGEWKGSGETQILVLTHGLRRATMINQFAKANDLPIVCACLPSTTGAAGLLAMRQVVEKVLTHALNAN
jgi:Replication-relaxation